MTQEQEHEQEHEQEQDQTMLRFSRLLVKAVISSVLKGIFSTKVR